MYGNHVYVTKQRCVHDVSTARLLKLLQTSCARSAAGFGLSSRDLAHEPLQEPKGAQKKTDSSSRLLVTTVNDDELRILPDCRVAVCG